MNLLPNSRNEPDINGFEMKKSAYKITLGDFSASEYLFSNHTKRPIVNYINKFTNDIKIDRNEFIRYFGNYNETKNRYSWSGKCIPKYKEWSINGQILLVLKSNDIVIVYSFSKDTRITKHNIPEYLKKEKLLLAIWKSSKMKQHIENKFNKNGFFICKKKQGTYQNISFGKPFDFEYFIECIKNRKVFFDSGMYEGNNRNYSHFRGIKFWKELIIEEY